MGKILMKEAPQEVCYRSWPVFKPRGGGGLSYKNDRGARRTYIYMYTCIFRLVLLRVLKYKKTTGKVIAVPFRVLSKK